MKNEQKAFELSSRSKYDFTIEESNAAYNAAIEAMKWKEQQMIKMAKDFLYENFYEHPHHTGHICTDIDGLHDEDDAMDVLADSLEKAMMEE